MAKKQAATLGLCALGIYFVGGLGAFAGMALIAFMKGRDLWGLGDGRSIGFLFLCVGMLMTMLGVLLMRIFRNRGMA